jgi:hypothetical protein
MSIDRRDLLSANKRDPRQESVRPFVNIELVDGVFPWPIDAG